MDKNTIEVKLSLIRNNKKKIIKFKYKKKSQEERPMALDILLQVQEKKIDDLAFRYGCRARNCGICTIDVNNKPRLACRSRVKEGDTLSAINTLPIIQDFVVERDKISKQMIGYNKISLKNNLNVEADITYHKLTACIECYACLEGCPMHAKNDFSENKDAYTYGNPFSLLKLQRLYVDPLTPDYEKATIISKAKSLGLETCLECPGCKCSVGINLKEDVIKPLLEKGFKRN